MSDIMNYSSSCCQEQSFFIGTTVPEDPSIVGVMNMVQPFHPQTVVNFVTNLKQLLATTKISKKDVAKKAGVTPRYIDKLLTYGSYPTIEVAEGIGSAFGVSGWQMIMPNLHYELAKSGKLDKIIDDYSASSSTTQEFICEVLAREIAK
jgi:transcriptional regulator with XRE-family HTH domain